VVYQLCGADFSYVTGTEIFLTGGEPFLLPDIGAIVRSCAACCRQRC